MGGLILAGMALLSASISAPRDTLSVHAHVTIDRPDLRLIDLADLSALPPSVREAAASVVVMHLEGRQTSIALSDRAINARLRSRMPLLARWLPEPSGRLISVRYRPRPVAAWTSGNRARPCIRALGPVEAGAAPLSASFERSDCVGRPEPAFRYDPAARAVRARRAIAPGEVVAAYADFGLDSIAPGQPLLLAVMAGGIRVERQVRAVQSVRAGQRLFVRSDDGELMSARYEGAEP